MCFFRFRINNQIVRGNEQAVKGKSVVSVLSCSVVDPRPTIYHVDVVTGLSHVLVSRVGGQCEGGPASSLLRLKR